jgi:predicted esterase
MEFTFKHSKSFRYEVINGDVSAKTVLYVLHGYGHLAKHFIQKFKELPKDLMIVAPEGMHRFYLNGNFGRVGASWMTKEAREMDIEDNVSWLNALDDEICSKYPIENKILLGFSQGGSTAIRWNLNTKLKFISLIIWASDFPREELKDKSLIINEQPNHFIVGNNDEIIKKIDQPELIRYYESIGFKISTYIGNHDINTETLLATIRQINYL